MTGTQAAIIDEMLKVEPNALEGALVSLSELRDAVQAKWKITDDQFEKEILKLANPFAWAGKNNKWALHLHSQKSILSDKQKKKMVPIHLPDGSTEYAIGIALRSEHALDWGSTKSILK